MKDIPVFSCPDGIATLILREVPFRGEGYILVRGVFGTLEGLLAECAAFAAPQVRSGCSPRAKRIFPAIRPPSAFSGAARLVPVTEETAADWAREYNARFRAVPAAESCSPAEERALAAGGEALWIWDGAERIGLGRVRGGELLAVAALQPGAGERCVRALAARCAGPEVRLTCAEENTRAMRLYDRLGFSRGAEERVWFSI